MKWPWAGVDDFRVLDNLNSFAFLGPYDHCGGGGWGTEGYFFSNCAPIKSQ